MIKTTLTSLSITLLTGSIALPALLGVPQDLPQLPYILALLAAITALVSKLYANKKVLNRSND